MSNQSPAKIAAATILGVLSVTLSAGQQLGARSDPAAKFDPRADPIRTSKSAGTTPDAGRVNPASPVYVLPQHGNVNGGVDHGYNNVGVVFGARIYSGNLVVAIELFYYTPSNPDNVYREGDSRTSTGRIGSNGGTENVEYCPEGHAAVGLQGASGLAIDRVGLICGKIGDLSKVVALPIFGGNGGNAFNDNCASTRSLGFLTGVRVRSGAWMDSIQGLCQAGASAGGAPETPTVKANPVVKVADDLAATIAVGAGRSEVLQKLGEPNSKISGDFERFTYQLESGGTLRIEFEDGRVTKVQNSGGH
jgi:hypothetical protein